jgi:hypothetical protein
MNLYYIFLIPAFIAALINDLIKSKIIKSKTQAEIYFMCKMILFLILVIVAVSVKDNDLFQCVIGFGAGLSVTFPRFKKKQS